MLARLSDCCCLGFGLGFGRVFAVICRLRISNRFVSALGVCGSDGTALTRLDQPHPKLVQPALVNFIVVTQKKKVFIYLHLDVRMQTPWYLDACPTTE